MICIYHSRDLDGWCSGAILKKKYPEATFVGYDYGEAFPWDLFEKGEKVVMADVSLPMEDMEKLAAIAGPHNFVWIDHHISAIKAYNDFHFSTPFTAFLDPKISACERTWMVCFPEEFRPLAVKLLGKYDTFRKNDKHAWDNSIMPFQYGMRVKCNSLETFPMAMLDTLSVDYSNLIDDTIFLGIGILKYQDMQNESMMKASFVKTIGPYTALCCNVGLANFNSNTFKSVFDPLKHDIMVAFCLKHPNYFQVSFYSENPGIDVSEIAKRFGGGGHKGAAGCQVPFIDEIFNEEE